MGFPWESDVVLDEAVARARIGGRFPRFAASRIRELGAGWDSVAFLVDETWVFRLGKHAECADDARHEIPLLRLLAGRLPAPIPEVAFDGGTFFGYRFLPGRALEDFAPEPALRAALAPQCAAFLTALHAANPASTQLPAGPRLPLKLRDRAVASYPGAERTGAPMARICARLEQLPTPFAGAPVVVHNDLLNDHVLLDGDRLAAVIDWSDARLGDPAADFAGFAYWGGEGFVREILATYGHPVDAGLVERACWTALCIAVEGVRYGVEAGREDYLRTGREAIRLLLP
jgi:aminoglycoside phosphotransferase (APT) family kinase protein